MLKLKYLTCLTSQFYLCFHILRCLFSLRSWLLLRLFSQIPYLSYSSDLCILFGPFLPLEFSVLQWYFAFYSGPYPTYQLFFEFSPHPLSSSSLSRGTWIVFRRVTLALCLSLTFQPNVASLQQWSLNSQSRRELRQTTKLFDNFRNYL